MRLLDVKGENVMFLDQTLTNYQQLITGYFVDHPELAQWLLKRAPTPVDFRQLSKSELYFFKSKAPGVIGPFLSAVQIGELVVKCPRNLYGHAYSSALVGEAFIEEYAGDQQESVTILCTDVHNEIIARQQLFVGGQSQCSLFPDQIFRYALKNSATGVIVVHNHPSGNIEPSDNDLLMCQRIERAGNAIGISLLDFMIIGNKRYYSWRESMVDL